jgi:hypothetical protein
VSGLGWWTISGEAILHMLRRVADGEYANSEHDYYPDGDD